MAHPLGVNNCNLFMKCLFAVGETCKNTHPNIKKPYKNIYWSLILTLSLRLCFRTSLPWRIKWTGHWFIALSALWRSQSSYPWMKQQRKHRIKCVLKEENGKLLVHGDQNNCMVVSTWNWLSFLSFGLLWTIN